MRTGETLSFTGHLVFCLARAVDEDKSVQAYLKGRKHLVVFDDVDVSMSIARQIGETLPRGPRDTAPTTRLPGISTRRSATVQTQPVPSSKGLSPTLRFAMLLPQPLPKLIGVLIRAITQRDPTVLVARGGLRSARPRWACSARGAAGALRICLIHSMWLWAASARSPPWWMAGSSPARCSA